MKVYLDNASTTNVSKEVFEAMKPYFTQEYGNPSSLHNLGISNRKIINTSRRKIAELLHCDRNEIYFTSCGTESINWAIKGIALSNRVKSEIITTKIEHHASLHSCQYLETRGYTVHYLDVDKDGFIDMNQLRSLVNNNTLLVSIIMANNEIGTIQNIAEIQEICEANSTFLHLDAVQASCHTTLNLETLKPDLLSLSGHKFHGPKGIGLLYIKKGTAITSLLHGGQQENELRAGTENVAYIVGFTKALEIGIKDLGNYEESLNEMASLFLSQLDKANVDYILNGPSIGNNRLPGNLNLSFKGVEGSDLTYYLNKHGISVSTGSACDSESVEPSHVLKNIGVAEDYINASIRFSIGKYNTSEEIIYAAQKLIEVIELEKE